jgi:hypothetical protein
MSSFSPDNFIFFKINGNSYLLNKKITRKMGIFNVINDCPDSSEILEFEMNLEIKYIDLIFEMVSQNIEHIQLDSQALDGIFEDIDIHDLPLDKIINIIIGMKYLAIDIKYIDAFCVDIIYDLCAKPMDGILAMYLLEFFKTVPPNEEMKYIIDVAIENFVFTMKISEGYDILKSINIIKNDKYYPDNFKYKIIKLLILQHVGTSHSYKYPNLYTKLTVHVPGNSFSLLKNNIVANEVGSSSYIERDNLCNLYGIPSVIDPFVFYLDDNDNYWVIMDDNKIKLRNNDISIYSHVLEYFKVEKTEKYIANIRYIYMHIKDPIKLDTMYIYVNIFHAYIEFIMLNIMKNM